MKGFARRRRAAFVARIACWLALAAAAPVVAEELCTAAAPCGRGSDSLRGPVLPAPPVLRGAAGGGRAPLAWPRGSLAVSPSTWSPAMSRNDVRLGLVDPDHDDGYLYRLPYADDVSYPLIQAYGARLSHRGAEQYTLDFGMPVGTSVHAARDGVVVLLEDSHDGGCPREECGRLANFVVLLHADGTTGEYFHLQRGSVTVRLGEHVRRGQALARSGNTGFSTAPHLHFGVYRTERNGRTQSLAVRLQTRVGAIATPRSGAHYRNVTER